MRIKNMTVTSTFKYLWLKTVTDVDLSQHCAKCLIGEYDTWPPFTVYSNISEGIHKAKYRPKIKVGK